MKNSLSLGSNHRAFRPPPMARSRGFCIVALASEFSWAQKAGHNSSNALRFSPVNALNKRSSFSTRLISNIVPFQTPY